MTIAQNVEEEEVKETQEISSIGGRTVKYEYVACPDCVGR